MIAWMDLMYVRCCRECVFIHVRGAPKVDGVDVELKLKSFTVTLTWASRAQYDLERVNARSLFVGQIPLGWKW